MAHQLRAIQMAQKQNRLAFFWEPGCGKTIAVYGILADRKSRGLACKTVVLAPKSILRSAWAGDGKHFPGLKVVVCWSAKPMERRRLIETPDADVLITNYETFRKNAEVFRAVGVRCLVVDESSKIKSPDSLISKTCIAFSDWMESVYVLSGTPAPNDSTEYWAQMRCVDRSVFGPHFFRFCYSYFSPVKREIAGRERIIAWKPLPEQAEEFTERLRSRSWSLKKTECLDLPPQTDIIRDVELGTGEAAAYASMVVELKVEFAGGVMTAAAQAKAMKLRQITGGAIYTQDGSVTVGDSKIKELGEVLDEIGDRQVVLWGEFTSEINRMAALLDSRGAAYGILDGKTPLPAREESIASFQSGGLQYLICNPAAAGHGVTLTSAAYDIFYSHSYSYETYEQARNRIHRAGQSKPVTHYHLIAANTIDERIWECLNNKQSGQRAIFELLGAEWKEVAA